MNSDEELSQWLRDHGLNMLRMAWQRMVERVDELEERLKKGHCPVCHAKLKLNKNKSRWICPGAKDHTYEIPAEKEE